MSAATEVAVMGPSQETLRCDLSWLLAQASHALATQQTAALEALGIAPRGYCVLATAATGEFTQTEIAQAVAVDKTTMVVTVDALAAAGLVERLPSPTDRRARVIGVTKEGRKKAAAAVKVTAQLQQDVLAALPAAQRDAVLAGLQALVDGPLGTPAACSAPVRRREPRPSSG